MSDDFRISFEDIVPGDIIRAFKLNLTVDRVEDNRFCHCHDINGEYYTLLPSNELKLVRSANGGKTIVVCVDGKAIQSARQAARICGVDKKAFYSLMKASKEFDVNGHHVFVPRRKSIKKH